MKNKSIFMLVVLLTNIVFPLINTVSVLAEGYVGQDIRTYPESDLLPKDSNGEPTIVTNAKLTHNNEEIGQDNPITWNDKFQITYDLEIPDPLAKVIVAGDYFTFQLVDPNSGVKLSSSQAGDLIDPDYPDKTFGVYTTKEDGTVELVFNDNVSTMNEVDGTLVFTFILDKEIVTETGTHEVYYPGVSTTESETIFVSNGSKNYLSKSIDNSVSNNGITEEKGIQTLHWKVLINPNALKIVNPVLNEFTTSSPAWNESQKYKNQNVATSYNVEKLVTAKVGPNGVITEGEEVAIGDFDESRNLKLSDEINEPYVLYVSTPIYPDAYGSIVNTATLTGDNIQETKATASINAGRNRNIVNKKATDFNEDTQKVSWEIDYNVGGNYIPKEIAWFDDEIDSFAIFLEDTFKVTPDVPYELTKTPKGFHLQFTEDVTEPLKITYQVQIKPEEVGKHDKLKNAVLTDTYQTEGSQDLGNNNNNQPGPGGDIPKSTISKTHVKPEITAEQMTWKMTLNSERQSIDGWRIVDTLNFNEGNIIQDSIVVTDKTAGVVVPESDYTTKFENKNKFTIEYNHQTDHTFEIAYDSTLKPDRTLINNVTYYYKIGNDEGKDTAVDNYHHPKGNEISLSKEGRFITGQDKVEWIVGINTEYVRTNPNGLLIDPVPEGQEYIEGSLKVYRAYKWSTGLSELASEVEAKYNPTLNQIEASVPEGKDIQYKVIFKTTLTDKDQLLNDEVTNTAYFSDDYNKEKKVTAKLQSKGDQDYFAIKSGYVLDPTHMAWNVRLNPDKFHLKDVEVQDYNWVNQRVDPNTVAVKVVTGPHAGEQLIEGVDYDFDYTERYFNLKFKEDVTEEYRITYNSVVIFPENSYPGQSIPVKNGIKINATNVKIESGDYDVSVPVIRPDSSGVITGKNRIIELTKVDSETGEHLEGAEFTLYRGEKIEPEKIVDIKTSDSKGKISFDKLTYDNYLLVETKAPEGYYISQDLKNGIPYEITKDSPTMIESKYKNSDIEDVEDETVDIEGQKFWIDSNDQDGKRPSSIEVVLLANGEEIDSQDIVPDDDGFWYYQFEDLPKYDKDEEINYVVMETTVPDYTGTVIGDNIFNTYKPKKTSVSVVKRWEDNHDQDGKRPESISVQLLADNQNLGEPQILDSNNNWSHIWEDLDMYNDGKEIVYTIEEINVPEGYVSNPTTLESGIIQLTNKHTPETTEAEVNKKWYDNDNQDGKRPEQIGIILLADGEPVEAELVELNEDNDWYYCFVNLPKYQKGKEIIYTVAEVKVEGYSSKTIGYDLENTYTPGKTSVKVTKTWEDHHNQDGKRPNSVKVQLLANDEKYGEPEILNSTNNWTHTWTDLAEYESGELITYTVEEVKIPNGYTSLVEDTAPGVIQLINKHTPETTVVEGVKTWQDNNNQDGKRPEKVKVILFGDGAEVTSKEISKSDEWSYKFDDLPKYKDGKEIKYTVAEAGVDNYSVSIKGYDLTNTYTPGKTSFTVTKAWNDKDNQDGKRPSSISVQLLADGKEYGSPEILSNSNNWEHTWTELDEYESGKKINYTVEEIDTPKGYTSNPYMPELGVVTLTNEYTPEITEVEGVKTWNDKDNQDGKRPEEVTVILLGDGMKVDCKKINESNNWTYKFTNLPKYKDGKEIDYTVVEPKTENYSSKAVGYNLTNCYTPRKTSVSVTKSWEDNNNQDGKRPDSIAVQLLANDEKYGDPEILNKSNHWSHIWQDLDEYKDGKEVAYRIEEIDTPEGYVDTSETLTRGVILLNNEYTPETTDIKGNKTWQDNDNQDGKRPGSIEVILFGDGEEVARQIVKPDSSGTWQYEYNGLPKYDNGREIVYTVAEAKVEDYTSTVEGTNLKNTYTPGKTSMRVTKSWEDNYDQDGKRPDSVSVQLLANGKKHGKPEILNKDKKWTHTWENLDEYKSGKLIEYTIEEINQPSGYKSESVESAPGVISLTNKHTPEEIVIEGVKIWEDNYDQDGKRPSNIEVILFGDGEEVARQKIGPDDNWKYKFDSLPKYSKGQEIVYTVIESSVSDYSSSNYGVDLVNKYTPGKTSVTVEKSWEDCHNQDGKRPESISVQLLANGEKEGGVETLASSNSWKYTWENLDEYRSGEKVDYTIEEVDVPDGYVNTSTILSPGVIQLTNVYKPEKIAITGSKTWEDNDNQDGKRPDSIEVILFGDGEEVAKQIVKPDSSGNWNYEYNGLPKYKNGQEIVYNVVESKVEDYTCVVSGTDLVNTYSPSKTSISVIKSWEDKDDQDGKRPDNITVQLLANGKKHGKPEVLSKANKWTHTWQDLDEYASGKEIVYTIKEVKVPHSYSSTVSIIAPGVIQLTNEYTPEEVDIEGVKTWEDKNNQDGKRPTDIEVILLADGKEASRQEVKPDEFGKWTYRFESLPKYASGQEIVYTVAESKVKDYSSAPKNLDLVNTYSPGQTSLTVTKAWEDKNNQDGKRPDSISVQLLADGIKTGKVELLNTYNNWTHTWENLPEYASGQEIVYTIEEIDIPLDYKSTSRVISPGVIQLTNTYTPEEVCIEGTKTWNDDEDQVGKRPENIEVVLLANGQEISRQEVKADKSGNWVYKFESLPKYVSGEEIVYTVTEAAVTDYVANPEGVDLVNSYAPDKTSLTVTKAWEDKQNQDGKRPDSIYVQLLANGKKQGKPVGVNVDTNWTYTWTDLDKKVNDKEITYSVEEVKVPSGYTSQVGELNNGNITITNYHTPKTVNKKNSNNKVSKNLPKTGEIKDYYAVLLGLIFISLFGVYIGIKNITIKRLK